MSTYPSDKQVLYAASLARKRNIGLSATVLQDKTAISKFINDSLFAMTHLKDYTDLYRDGMTVADAIVVKAADPRQIKERALAHLRINGLDVSDLYIDGMTVEEAIDVRAADPRQIKDRALAHLRINGLDVSHLYTDGMTVAEAVNVRTTYNRRVKSKKSVTNTCDPFHSWGATGDYGPRWGSTYTGD
tara:strand:- start:14 stop:577 length:564 start_codon:yes stop_codon:yes gene_type:complete